MYCLLKIDHPSVCCGGGGGGSQERTANPLQSPKECVSEEMFLEKVISEPQIICSIVSV